MKCLGWWLWTSVCGTLNPPQADRIQTFSGLSKSLVSLHCLFSCTFCYLLQRLSVEFTHINMSVTQKAHLASRDISYFATWREYKGMKQSCACHARAALLTARIEKDYNKLLAVGCSILTSAHCTLIQIINPWWSGNKCNDFQKTKRKERKVFKEAQLES